VSPRLRGSAPPPASSTRLQRILLYAEALTPAAFVLNLDAPASAAIRTVSVYAKSWFMAPVKVVFLATRKDDMSTILDTRVCAWHGKLFVRLIWKAAGAIEQLNAPCSCDTMVPGRIDAGIPLAHCLSRTILVRGPQRLRGVASVQGLQSGVEMLHTFGIRRGSHGVAIV
jgi:hypothetical protein